MTLVQRLAHAIENEFEDLVDPEGPASAYGIAQRIVRKLFTEIREPSDLMIEAGTDEYPDADRGLRSDRAARAEVIWKAMIDAALAET